MSVTAKPFQNGYTDGFDVFIGWRVGGLEKESANEADKGGWFVGCAHCLISGLIGA